MAKPFAEVTARTQVNRLRELARSALPSWGLEDASLSLLFHGYNTTFRVETTGGRRFALRVNTQPHKTDAHLQGELAWLAALSAQTPLHVPTPQPTRTGALSTSVASADHGRALPMVLFSWLDGRNLGDRWTNTQAQAVGAAMATLHDHAESWTMPPGAAFSPFDNVLTDLPNRLADHPALDAQARAVLTAAYERAQDLQNEAFAAGTVMPLHADLHGGNLKWGRTNVASRSSGSAALHPRLSIFDFDDAGLGVAALDLAISAYYLRDDHAAEAALKAGYASVRALPSVTDEQFEAMVAGRNLLLVNDVIEQPNADLQAMVPAYVADSVARQRQWLNSGRWVRRLGSTLTDR
jgi:Ser/Thr protein kinase RdoA (MazF antagonist)